MENLAQLETEGRNPRTAEMDTLTTAQLVQTLHTENYAVALAVEAVLPQIAQVVDAIAERWERGGRLLYVGAGTSGRLGVLDASECPPTFGVEPEQVQGIIAGGRMALTSSLEDAEDEPETGAQEIQEHHVGVNDVVVGIAASGRTPYVCGALGEAKQVGAFTAAIVNVSHSELSRIADVTIAALTGPEPLTGSTRLKAGTAQKLILNLLTTAAMVRTGKVYGNLMVDVRASNVKLRNRALRIVLAATNSEPEAAQNALEAAEGHAKTAILMLRAGLSAEEARQRLEATRGHLRKALGYLL